MKNKTFEKQLETLFDRTLNEKQIIAVMERLIDQCRTKGEQYRKKGLYAGAWYELADTLEKNTN